MLLVMAMSITVKAQDYYDGNKGLFGRGCSSADLEYSGTRDGLLNANIDSNTGGGIQNDDFGAPLGSGIVILLGAGLGYVALKKKEDEQ